MSGSRITCVKKVLKKAINDIAEKHPNRKVGIVLFENKVKVLGDCSQRNGKIISKISNFEFLKE